ncbi:MAG: 50S ribosomal protein L18e [Thermoplasmata archaeon]
MKNKKTNPELVNLILDLKKKSREADAPIWRDVAFRLEGSNRNRAEVNVSKIERFATPHETIIVPGKLLGAGEIKKPVTVAAYAASASAIEKVTKAGGRVLSLRELLAENPKGTNVRILG